MQYQRIMKELKAMGNQRDREGMARFGINTEKAFGISVTKLRKYARKIGKNHELAQQLWDSGAHEARILAGIVEEPEKFSERNMEKWAAESSSWDIVDLSCNNVFRKTPYAYKKCFEYSKRKEEFVKRTAFALMAYYAWNDRTISDRKLEKFLPIIKREATDERLYVKKAVNWALRQIGKRNARLQKKSIKTAKEIQKIDSKSAKWIANDALKELQSDAVQKRIKN